MPFMIDGKFHGIITGFWEELPTGVIISIWEILENPRGILAALNSIGQFMLMGRLLSMEALFEHVCPSSLSHFFCGIVVFFCWSFIVFDSGRPCFFIYAFWCVEFLLELLRCLLPVGFFRVRSWLAHV